MTLINNSGQSSLESIVGINIFFAAVLLCGMLVLSQSSKIWLAYQARLSCYCLLSQKESTLCLAQLRERLSALLPTSKIEILHIHQAPYSSHLTGRMKLWIWHLPFDQSIQVDQP